MISVVDQADVEFLQALLRAGYAPSTARKAVTVAKRPSVSWASRLREQWEAGELKPRRSEQARIALALMGEGRPPSLAHEMAKSYLTWKREGGEPDTAVAEVERFLGEPDLFRSIGGSQFNFYFRALGLDNTSVAALLGVSRQTVGNWLAGKPTAPDWACDILAAQAAEQRPEGAKE